MNFYPYLCFFRESELALNILAGTILRDSYLKYKLLYD